MYKVKSTALERPVTIACGTPEQVLEMVARLIGQGHREITVTDPAGKSWPAADFRRALFDFD